MKKRLSNTQRVFKYGDPRLRTTQAKIARVQMSTSNVRRFVHVNKEIEALWLHCYRGAQFRYPGSVTRIDSLNVRRIAGSSSWSLHSWALAWDVFGNGPRIDPKTGLSMPPDEWFQVFTSAGFVRGDRWKSPDPHHLEWPY